MGIGNPFWTYNVGDAAVTVAILLLILLAPGPGLPAAAMTTSQSRPAGSSRPGDGPARVDRFVADVRPVAKPRPKLISEGRLTLNGGPSVSGAELRLGWSRWRPSPPSQRSTSRRPRGRRPAHHRQAGRARRPAGGGPRRRHPRQRPPGTGRGGGLRGDRRRPPAGHRPPPRPRHERPAHGRQGRRGAGQPDGPAQGAPGEKTPRARQGSVAANVAGSSADRARSEAPDADGGRADGRPSDGYRVRERLAAGRSSSSISSRVAPTNPGPPVRDRPPGRRRSAWHGNLPPRPEGLARLFLHAWRLELASPSDGRPLRQGAAPAELEAVLERLRAGDRPEPLPTVPEEDR